MASSQARRGAGGFLALALLVFLALPAWAQEAERPISEGEFVSLVNAKTPEGQLIEAVRARGVSFKPSANLEEALRALKLTNLLAALTEPATLDLTVGVPEAEVLVDGEKRGTSSAEGRAVIAGIPPGDRHLQVRAQDYVDASQTIFLKPGETRQVQLELRAAVTLNPGPLGSRVSVQAGTPADSVLAALEFARGAERIELLKKLVGDYSHSPLALLGYGMLQEAYLSEAQYDDSLAAGDEVLTRDPKNFSARVRRAQAYLGKGEAETALKVAGEARALREGVAAAEAPADADPAAWQREKERSLEGTQSEWNNLAYSTYVALSQVAEPARKRALLEQFVEVFPQSAYRPAALVLLAVSAQQLGDAEGALRYAGQGLELNPDSPTLLLLVSDVLSERGQELGRARELATRLLTLLQETPDKVRPEGVSDEQWTEISQLWEGTAHSVLGQVLMYEETSAAVAGMAKTRQAVEEFKTASPLLKPNPFGYARNLYRLGYAYAKLGQRPEARQALSEVMTLDTPYRQVAGPLLEKVK